MPAKMPMMAMTTSNSINVKPALGCAHRNPLAAGGLETLTSIFICRF
jgi:hypothetical protein